MKKTNILCFALASLFIVACGKKDPTVLRPATTIIDGDLGNQFTLVDKEYSYPKYDNALSITLKRTDKPYADSFTQGGIGIEFYDKNGKVVATQEAELGYITPFEWGFLETKEGEEVNKRIYLADWPDGYKGAETFKITLISNSRYTDLNDAQLSPDDFIVTSSDNFGTYSHVCLDESLLEKKGFKVVENEDPYVTLLRKGDTTIEYYEDFSDDGTGSRCITITFPDMDDAYKFAAENLSPADWTKSNAALGEFYTHKNGQLRIYHEISMVQISEEIE